jgi:hypothetical protein
LPKDDWGDGEEKLKQARQNLIKAEVEKMEKREAAKA